MQKKYLMKFRSLSYDKFSVVMLEGRYLSTVQAIFDSPMANNALDGLENKRKNFPPKFWDQERLLMLPHLFNIVITFLSRAIRQEKEIEVTPNRKEDLKLGGISQYLM